MPTDVRRLIRLGPVGGTGEVVFFGEPEWPTQLDDLGDARPVVLWLRGTGDLRYACLRSVSVVGARDTALRCLGLLAAAGHIERCELGWRARKNR